jgi:hypothetical protein
VILGDKSARFIACLAISLVKVMIVRGKSLAYEPIGRRLRAVAPANDLKERHGVGDGFLMPKTPWR